MASRAKVVTDVFGIRPLAERLEVSPSTVWRWDQPKPRGCNGLIPSDYHRPILALARELGKPLTPHDLIYGRPDAEAQA